MDDSQRDATLALMLRDDPRAAATALYERFAPEVNRWVWRLLGADPDHNDNSGRSARQYMELMTGNTLMKQVFEEADAKRAGTETKRRYGPAL